MERVTKSIRFYCRESKKDRKGYSPLEMSVTINGERVFIAIPQKFRPGDFNQKRQPKYITDYVDSWRIRLTQIEGEMVIAGIPLTPDNLKRLIRSGGVQSCKLSDVISGFMTDLKHRAECPVYRKYEMVYERLVRELGDKEIKEVTNGEIARFYTGLCQDYKPQTSAGMMQKIRSLFKYALAEGKITRNPCEGIRVSRGKTVIDFITPGEIEMLCKADLANDALQRTLDVFIFMCASGLAYADVARLTREDMNVTENGTFFLNKTRKKTGTSFTTVILPFGVEVWKKYDGVLPVLTNQKMNLNLRIIEDVLGFKKHLHCHCARHSFAMLLLNSGIRIETVAEALGHRDIKVTMQHYARIQQSTVLNEVSALFAK